MEILLVDDDPLIQELLPAVLRKAFGDDVEIAAAADLESAFQRLAHHKAPDLALLDLGLPGHAGIETLRRFRYKFSTVPVVVVSALEDPAVIRVAQSMGVSGYLPKTHTPDQMIEGLRKVAEGGLYFPTPDKPA